MAYDAKTNWLPDDPINEDDVNRWEKGIQDAHKDLAKHKNDMNNPHKVTKEQLGLGNVDDVKQADFYEFREHDLNSERHVTKNDKDKWNAGQLYKLTQDNGKIFYKASSETTDYNELTDTGMYLIYNAGLNGPDLPQCFLLVMSYGNTLVQTAYDATNGLKSFNRIRKNDWETWTPWIEIETVEGAQKKVDAHANKTDIHVSKSDKDKWNAAQLSKLTQDDGKRTRIPDGTDILSLTTGFYYGAGTAMVNSPADGDGSWFNYDVIEGVAGRKSIFASRSYDNTLWYGSVHTDGVFKGWKQVESEAGSKEKADKALSDAKVFVQENFTNQKLTVLTGKNSIQDVRISGEEYPLGLTFMDIGQANTTGYPLRYGIVKNEKYSNYRFAQYFYGTGNESGTYFDSTGVWIRHWWSGSGWTPWQKISGFVHANIGTTGKQLLIKGEQQKVRFNRKIKDSHNAFDVTNNRFICPNSGMFLVNAGLYIENVQRYANYEMEIYLNGTIYKNIAHYRNSPANPSDTTQFNVGVYGAATVPANAGDYIEIYLYVGYDGDVQRYITDNSGWYNYFDITEMGGRNYPRF
ncbi:pyocin knob domain-containing protein [Bacillus vallismortis]|uniref:pyocin knob domain-containing protein n=1 Tax=Bacillus vallismortis TaxID=72361 RepID=UPI002DB9C1E2|nr:pyocin knob domain-containing protein [Bacillus vallismortis]MEC1270499.1 pyocin knob domain-containing protein [Bacillus vallismortis]